MPRTSSPSLPITSLGVLLAASDLLQAFDYAADVGGDLWQFAVDWRGIRGRGATLNDIRWLLARKFVEHARETTSPTAARRTFEKLALGSLPADMSLVLTSAGATVLRPFLSVLRLGLAPLSDLPFGGFNTDTAFDATPVDNERSAVPDCVHHRTKEVHHPTPPTDSPSGASSHPAPSTKTRNEASRPVWEKNLRELRFGKEIVKRFRVPAENQEIILAVFQEEGWPESIDDPLPPAPHIDPKRRLQATIKSLNRHQIVPLLRFHGNGGGRVIYWNATRPRRK